MIDDVVQSWRAIRKMPLVAAVVVVSLAVGIGVNTAVFSWIQGVILHPLPGVRDAASFQFVEPRADTGSYPGMSWREYQDVSRRFSSARDLLAFRMVPFNVGEPGRTERAYGQLVSGNYFAALGLKPAMGRLIEPGDAAKAGGEPIVVVSHDYWRTRLGAAPDAVGRTLRVNDIVVTIIGVAPERFQGTILGLSFDMWAPATLAPVVLNGSRELDDRGMRGYSAMGLLRPGVTSRQAQAELDRIMRDLAAAYPDSNAAVGGEVLPFWSAPRGPQHLLEGALLLLQGILLLLLLAVCGNTANLMLARTTARRREMGVRLALGAGTWRLVRLVMTENLMLSVASAAAGAAIAVWASTALRAVPIITAFPIKFQTDVDAGTIAFALGVGVACGLLFGAAPALQLATIDPQTSVRAGSRTAGRSALRNTLMAVEVGLALLVLLAAGMFLRGFTEARGLDPGFRREGVLLAAYDLTGRNFDAAAVRTFTTRLLDRVRALPQVEAAAMAAAVPLDIHGLPLRGFTIDTHPRSDGASDQALTNTITPGYFAAMAIPFRAGRDFVDLADRTTPPEAIVNEEFVRRFVGRDDVPGRRFRSRDTTYTIVGVVRNSISESFGEPPTPVIYVSYRDRPIARGEIHLRTRPGAELLLGPPVERIVRDLDPSLPVYDVRTLADHVERNLFLRRIPARMFVVLGPMLLVLAAIGIYAVVAYTVSQRTTEIGVRLALGATAGRVVAQMVAESLRVVVAGAAVAWSLAVAVNMHLVRGPLYLSIFAGVPLLLLAVAAAACWIPARRAAAVDPMIALRHD